MAVWIDPVFDRTQEDVDFATAKIAEWVAATITGNPLIVYDLKGCLNVYDINRIEGNIAYLSEQLTRYYYHPSTSTKTWSRGDMPNQTDVDRIISNVKSLVESFCEPSNAPRIPSGMLDYEEVNSIERNLYLIKELLDCMVGSFKSSGTFNSGSTMYLPIRR